MQLNIYSIKVLMLYSSMSENTYTYIESRLENLSQVLHFSKIFSDDIVFSVFNDRSERNFLFSGENFTEGSEETYI